MEFAETLKLAFDAVWAHKLRSFLTLLGMIIGVSAVVLVVSLIQGFNRYVDEKIAGIGAKSFSVQRFNFDDFRNTDSMATAQRRNKDINFDDYEFLRERATLIGKMGYKARPSFATIKRGSQSVESVPVDGASPIIAEIDNLDIVDGRYFTQSEEDSAIPVIYLGSDVADKLFPSGNAIGQEVQVDGFPYRVIGVAAAKGTFFGQPQDNYATVPFKTYVKQFGPAVRQRSFYISATAKDDNRYTDAVEEARALMRVKRGLKFGEKDNFGIMTPDAILGIRDRLLGPIFIAAIAVPAIALVVGAIVIMNIMLVSVTERTREIGIRKSLGARQGDILKQFLIEAVLLSSLGGAMGVLIAWAIGRVLTALVFPTYLSMAAVFTAVFVSASVGILSGILPARKAAMLDPIVALRSE